MDEIDRAKHLIPQITEEMLNKIPDGFLKVPSNILRFYLEWIRTSVVLGTGETGFIDKRAPQKFLDDLILRSFLRADHWADNTSEWVDQPRVMRRAMCYVLSQLQEEIAQSNGWDVRDFR